MPEENVAWFAGDQHLHTTYSLDALVLDGTTETVTDYAAAAELIGLDWIIVTDHSEISRLFKARAIFAGVFVFLLIAALLTRLGWLQIVEYAHFADLSKENRVRLMALPPGRMCQYRVDVTDPGQVDGELLAWVREAYDQSG